MIRTEGPDQGSTESCAPSTASTSSARGRHLRIPRRQRIGQDHDRADAARSGAGHRGDGRAARPADAAAGARRCCPQVGALVEGPAAYPHLSGRANLALFDAMRPGRSRAPAARRIDEVLERVGLAAVDGGRSRRTRWACASGSGSPPPCCAPPAHPRRADQRAGPAGHPRDPRAAARAEPGGHDDLPVQPPARRDRADVRPGSASSTADGWCSQDDMAALQRPDRAGTCVRTPDVGAAHSVAGRPGRAAGDRRAARPRPRTRPR